MSTYDDWVVNFKVDTAPLDKALEKVAKLRAEINGLHGVGGLGGVGRRGGGGERAPRNQTPSQREAAERKRALIEVAAHNADSKRTRDIAKAELRAYDEAAKRVSDRSKAQRKLAQAELQAYREEAKRGRDLAQARQRADNSVRGDLGRRRAEAVRNLTAANPGSSDMRRYYAQLEAEGRRQSNIEQMRQVEMATRGAQERAQAERERQRLYDRDEAAAHRYNRWRNGQASATTRNANRADNFGAAQRSRELQLSRLEKRMKASGAGNMGDLANIRQRLGAATNQTQLNQLAPDMRNFVIQTNQAINAQNRLQRQMERNSFAVRSMSNSMANMARSYLSIYAVTGAAGSMYRNAKEMEALQTKLLMGTGSKAAASEAFNYVKGRANITGSDIASSTNLYAQMAITAKDSGLNKEQIKKIYEDTTTMQIGYGLTPDQQKLTTKAIIQMMSKQSVQAEEFKNQLGDSAPGVMGLLAKSMGLEEGPEGMRKLVVMMKKGQIGMKELFNFLDMAAKRAKETGAYDLAINSKQAAETRMKNSYKMFSDNFITFFDDKIKGTFGSMSASLDYLADELKKASDLQKMTGVVGENKTQLDYILYIFKTAGEGLMLGVESLYEFAKRTGVVSATSSMQTALADREAKARFLANHRDWKPSDVAGWEGKGMPGIDETIYKQLKGLGASDNEAQAYLDQFRERNPIPTNYGDLRKIPGSKLYQPAPMFEAPRYSGGMPMDNPANYRTIPNITVMINGVQVDPGSVEAQIANAFGNLYKPL